MSDFTWEEAASDVSAVVQVLSPLLVAAGPGVSVGLTLGMKIAQGVLALEPVAVALYRQIMSGTDPTQEQLADYAAGYEASYQELDADVKAKLALAPE